MSKEKDLFDDTTMSFGEHLEELRTRLILALLGLTVGVIIALFFSDRVMKTLEIPVKNALERYYRLLNGEADTAFNLWNFVTGQKSKPKEPVEPKPDEVIDPASVKTMDATLDVKQLLNALHKVMPKHFLEPPEDTPSVPITITVTEAVLKKVMPLPPNALTLTALTAEEAFMVYIKVAMVSGLILSSPWVFLQIWLFVAAGLYPHERKYVYIYLPMSIVLFFGGAIFCFFAVIPFVLNFLFDFNIWLDISVQPRLTEYVSFIVILPVMFGISFQLPLVMLFLERISIFQVAVYRTHRRIAILAIAFISMVLTPSDPVSMLLMMIPLCLLYELGILLCDWQPRAQANPFDDGQPRRKLT
ncbi:MAG: tatC [Planctomycetaceae bacterium]|nr:tatC [Planctomycetaceae bacterium]